MILSSFILVVSFLFPVLSSPQTPTGLLEDLLQSSADPFIIDGEPAEAGEIPYQAFLESGKNKGNTRALCGGSLIKPKWVLTAGHCVYNTDFTIVHLGSNDKKKMTYNETSYFRVVHALYNPLTLWNDVALVRLPVEAIGEDIRTIPIAPKGFSDLAGEEVQASGFGLTANTGNVPDVLNKVTLVAVTNQKCRNSYILNVLPSTLCATYLTRKGQSTCNGDSGGPLVYTTVENSTYLVGVTSFVSSKGCDSGELAGFARVSSQHDWIEDQISKNAN